jgi:hypothetical protein
MATSKRERKLTVDRDFLPLGINFHVNQTNFGNDACIRIGGYPQTLVKTEVIERRVVDPMLNPNKRTYVTW